MGKIQIDLKKLTNIKNETINNEFINSDAEKIIDQLKQHINSGNNSCFLVSGYRGTGKTSAIESLEKKMDDDHMLFIKLNISKYEEHCYIMRKLIREIYREYTSKNKYTSFNIKNILDKKYWEKYKNKKRTRKKESDFRKRIELLYDRTFNEIVNTNITKDTSIFSANFTKESNIKNLIELIFSIVTIVFTINYNFKYRWMKDIFKIISIIWIPISTLKIMIKISHELSISKEISRKSLYDDEIAELQLIDILKELNKLEYKVIIVLDELDKIENEDNINKILSEFKPLLISDLATFIVISGQKLYYQLSNSSIIDDSLISNIFSKTIHTPLASYNMLSELFSNCIIELDIDDDTKKKYIDSVILRSNTTIRLFINIISQDITWDENKSYIHIDTDNIGKFETDSKILKAVNAVVKENINTSNDLDTAIKDFFICQLYLWVKKMKLIDKVKFHIKDILNFEQDYSGIYPRWCEFQLNVLLNNLLENLVNNEEIMEKYEQGNDDEKVILYKWIDGIAINEESDIEKIAKIKINFIDEFIIMEKYCREICTVIDKNNYRMPFNQMITKMLELKIIDKNIYGELKNYAYLRNRIVHGEYIENIKEHDTRMSNMISIIIEKYSYHICKKYLEDKGYTLQYNNDMNLGVDFIAKNDDVNKEDILIEVKYIRYLSKVRSKQLINKLLSITNGYDYKKQFKLVALIYTEERINEQTNYIDKKFRDENLNTIYISNLLKLNIDSCFNNILDTENDDIINDEIAISIESLI
ncbi:ATP-binding protein [Paraclostridium dentum]